MAIEGSIAQAPLLAAHLRAAAHAAGTPTQPLNLKQSTAKAGKRSVLPAATDSSSTMPQPQPQPLTHTSLLSDVLYRLALAILDSGHGRAARSVLLAILPTHKQLPHFWLRLGEACVLASHECAASANERTPAFSIIQGAASKGPFMKTNGSPVQALPAEPLERPDIGALLEQASMSWALLLLPSPEPCNAGQLERNATRSHAQNSAAMATNSAQTSKSNNAGKSNNKGRATGKGKASSAGAKDGEATGKSAAGQSLASAPILGRTDYQADAMAAFSNAWVLLLEPEQGSSGYGEDDVRNVIAGDEYALLLKRQLAGAGFELSLGFSIALLCTYTSFMLFICPCTVLCALHLPVTR